MPAPLTPTQAADKILVPMIEGAPETTTPAAIKAVLTELRAFTHQLGSLAITAKIQGNISDIAYSFWQGDQQKWTDLLDYYEAQVDAAAPDDSAAVAKTVYGPLILGSCYGAPSCSDFLAQQWAPGGTPMAPTLTQPFILLGMLGAAEEAQEQNKVTTAIGEAIGDYIAAAAKAAGDVATAVAETVADAAAGALPDFKMDIPRWVWPLVGVAGAAMIYTAMKD